MKRLTSYFILFFKCILIVKCQEKCRNIECNCSDSQYRESLGACRDSLEIIECSRKLSENESIPKFEHVFYDRYGRQYPEENGQEVCQRNLLVRNSFLPVLYPGTFSNYPLVETLELHQDNITEIIPGTFDKLVELKSLKISNNQIGTIKRGTFNQVHKLRELHLDNNNITHIELQEETGELFETLSWLSKLDLSRNALKNFTVNVTTFNNFQTLDVSQNQLETFALNSVGVKWFEIVNLSRNHLETYKCDENIAIIALDLSNNRIRKLFDCSYVGGLLIVNNNLLEDMVNIDVDHVEIRLRGNRLKSLISHSISNDTKRLMALDVSHNLISSIDVHFFTSLSNLRQLYLGHNHLQKIELNVFKALSNLHILDLSSNNITHFPQGTFSNLKQLESLNLSNNRLIDIPYDLSFQHLEKLYFQHNPIFSFDIDEFLINFRHLKEVSMDGNEINQWSCKELLRICGRFSLNNITVLPGKSYDVENVQGIACKWTLDESEEFSHNKHSIEHVVNRILHKFKHSLKTIFENSDLYKFMQVDYKKSQFLKYLDSLHLCPETENRAENLSYL